MKQSPSYQSTLSSMGSTYMIDNKNISNTKCLQSQINNNNYLYNKKPISTYPHKTIYDFQNSSYLPKAQNVQYSDEINGERLTKSNISQYPNVYNLNAKYFMIPARNDNQYSNSLSGSNLNFNLNPNSNQNINSSLSLNQYNIQNKNLDFDRKINYITNSPETSFLESPTLHSKPYFTSYNEDSNISLSYNKNYPIQNFITPNQYIYNENEKENIYNVHNQISENSALTTTTAILQNENTKLDTLSNAPISGCISFIPQISEVNIIKPNLNILFEKEYMSEMNINHNGIKNKLPSNTFKNPIKIMAACSPMWTAKEDILLKDLKDNRHLSWKEISTYFPTRTLNACQFRWRRLTIKEKNKIKINKCKIKKLEQ